MVEYLKSSQPRQATLLERKIDSILRGAVSHRDPEAPLESVREILDVDQSSILKQPPPTLVLPNAYALMGDHKVERISLPKEEGHTQLLCRGLSGIPNVPRIKIIRRNGQLVVDSFTGRCTIRRENVVCRSDLKVGMELHENDKLWIDTCPVTIKSE
jgi:hypothetical protein